MARKWPSGQQAVAQAEALALEVLEAAGAEEATPEVVDALWRGEALGTLLWALGRAELPPYDEPFDGVELARDLELEGAELRSQDEISQERASAELWHWRARTTLLLDDPAVELPERWQSFDQLIAATAMKAYESGLITQPLRGDFRAFGKVYRHLSDEQHSLALSIAAERHHALNWLCGYGDTWNDTPTDT